jgi:hypothetical protein
MVGTLVGLAITAAVLAGLAAVTISLCRRLRPRTARAAARLGLLQGAAIVVLLLPLAALSARVVDQTHRGGATRAVWGTPALSLLWTAGVVLGVCVMVAVVWTLVAQRWRRGAGAEPRAGSV